MNSLGFVYGGRKNLPEAEKVFRQSLEIRRNVFGANHSSVAVAEANLAAILTARSKYGEAETLFVDALQILEKKPGERSLELPSILEAYALLLRLKSAEEASAMEA
ncbi:MAG: hypothetical protein DMG11_16785, partial [Acidobacteria bacterium]